MNPKWAQYLTRPFDLFGTSLWVEWYASPQLKRAVGMTLTKARCIELPGRGVVQYRDVGELKRFEQEVRRLANDYGRLGNILQKAALHNRHALAVMEHREPMRGLYAEIDFLTDLFVHATILPFFIGRYLPRRRKEFARLRALRRRSYYFPFYRDVVCVLARRCLRSRGVPDAVLGDCTLREISSSSFRAALRRHELRKKGKTFIYERIGTVEKVRMVSRPATVTRTLVKYLRGTGTYPGKVIGRVRLVFNPADARGITSTQVLIAPSTNPILVPFVRRAAAIVTDEGGVLCHAAIISREMKKPCVVGTKIATQVLKDGDLIEVDAERGIVRKLSLSRAKSPPAEAVRRAGRTQRGVGRTRER